nr:hypothetical protein [Bifidobacterium sp. 7101]
MRRQEAADRRYYYLGHVTVIGPSQAAEEPREDGEGQAPVTITDLNLDRPVDHELLNSTAICSTSKRVRGNKSIREESFIHLIFSHMHRRPKICKCSFEEPFGHNMTITYTNNQASFLNPSLLVQ